MPPQPPMSSQTPIPPLPTGDHSCAASSLPAPLHQLPIIALAAINNLYLPLRSSRDVPWDAEASLPCDSAPRRCSAPATGTLPVPGVLARLWQVAEWPGQAGDDREVALPCLCSCAELCMGHTPHLQGRIWRRGKEFQGEGGSFFLLSFVCKGKKRKKERRKRRPMSIFFSLLLMEARRAGGDLSPRFACLQGKS